MFTILSNFNRLTGYKKGKKILAGLTFVLLLSATFLVTTFNPFIRTGSAALVGTHPGLFFTQFDLTNDINKHIAKNEIRFFYYGFRTNANINPNQYGNINKWNDTWGRDLVESSFRCLQEGNSGSCAYALGTIDIITGVNTSYGNYRFTPPENVSDRGYGYQAGCSALPVAYDLIYSRLSANQKLQLEKLMDEWSAKILPVSYDAANHDGLVGCMGLIGLIRNRTNLVERAATMLKKDYYEGMFGQNGDYAEGNNFQTYGSGPSIMFAAAYQKATGTDLTASTHIANLWDYQLYSYLSNKQNAPNGDRYGTILDGEYLYFLHAASEKNDPKAANWLWLWNQIRGTAPSVVPPTPRPEFAAFDRLAILLYYPFITDSSGNQTALTPLDPTGTADFPDSKLFLSKNSSLNNDTGGMALLRNGWQPNNVTLWLSNSYSWRPHQHYDPNSFVLSAYGQPLITNERGICYWDQPYMGKLDTENGILIDRNLHKTPKENGAHTLMGSSLGLFHEFYTNPLTDMISSDARYPMSDFSNYQCPYGKDSSQVPLITGRNAGMAKALWDPNGNYWWCQTQYWDPSESKVNPILQADRVVNLIKGFDSPPYFVMLDEYNYDNQSSHLYTWQTHALGAVSGSGSASNPLRISYGGAYLDMVMDTPIPNTLRQVTAPKTVEQIAYNNSSKQCGTYAQRSDKLLQFEYAGIKGEFLSLMIPGNASTQAHSIRLASKNPKVYEIDWGNSVHIIMYNNTGDSVTYNGLTTDAVLLIAEIVDGKPLKYSVYRAKNLTYLDNPLLKSFGTISATAYFDQGVLKGTALTKQGAPPSLALFSDPTATFFKAVNISEQSQDLELAVSPKLEPPTLDPASTSFTEPLAISLSTSFLDREIRYTTDNSEPNCSSTLYQSPILLHEDTTLKSITCKNGWLQSDTSTGIYTYIKPPQAYPPIFSPLPGYYENPVKVVMTREFPTGEIHYTVDGSEPDCTSTLYYHPINLPKSVLIRALVCETGLQPSEITDGKYSIGKNIPPPPIPDQVGTPSFTPPPDRYYSPVTVTMAVRPSSAEIRYTTDGSIPTCSSKRYKEPILVNADLTLRAIGCKNNWNPSYVYGAKYTILPPPPVEKPIFIPASDNFWFRIY